jgi:hypothetical protein
VSRPASPSPTISRSLTSMSHVSFVCPLCVLCVSFVCPLCVLCVSFVCPLCVFYHAQRTRACIMTVYVWWLREIAGILRKRARATVTASCEPSCRAALISEV